ncbi:MAG: isoprenylcysteine carboxylmethyltransferase family protein [Methanospirillaceae archaeon]|nr:isoprenylcysteine carboxylmethyltransferase family protein [Methanospirillaceae archaeon]
MATHYPLEKIRIHGRILGGLIDFVIPAILFMMVGVDTTLHQGEIGSSIRFFAGVFFLLSCVLIIYAMIENYQFNALAPDESEKNEIVFSGPYRIVRHPGYAGGVVFYLTLPLLLGSLWAFIPGLLNSFLIFYYTALEDNLLSRDNQQYRDYMHSVPFRMIPGIW